MAIFKPTLGTQAQANRSPVIDGQFLVATDSRELYFDNNSLRIPLADIIFLATENEKDDILAPLQKFYFVISTQKLYLWSGTEWTLINDDPFDAESMPPPGSPATLLYVVHGKIRPLPLGKEGLVLTVRNQGLSWEKPTYK